MSNADPIALALPLRPQTFGRARADRLDRPVVEPLWRGLRVIAAASGAGAMLYAEGEPVVGLERVSAALARVIARSADGAILDGYVTKQVAIDELPAFVGTEDIPTTNQLVTKSLVGIRRNRSEERIRQMDADEAARTFAEDDIVNLVATDLLWLDGEWLLDVPLLERKRILESVVPGDDLVRAGPYVQPPFTTWIGSWRAQGFTGLTFKEANSRYRPGEEAADWTSSAMPRR
jgi:ATP dependent DNA ligase domain